jgi:hypothetical protein
MSKRIIVKFHLTGKDAEYARAFENQLTRDMNLNITLDEIIKRHFMHMVYSSAVPAEAQNELQVGDNKRDSAADAVPSEGANSTEQANSPGTDDSLDRADGV